MRFSLQKCRWVTVACLGLSPILAFAQSSDVAQNPADHNAGRDDRSKLSRSEPADEALAAHGRCFTLDTERLRRR